MLLSLLNTFVESGGKAVLESPEELLLKGQHWSGPCPTKGRAVCWTHGQPNCFPMSCWSGAGSQELAEPELIW